MSDGWIGKSKYWNEGSEKEKKRNGVEWTVPNKLYWNVLKKGWYHPVQLCNCAIVHWKNENDSTLLKFYFNIFGFQYRANEAYGQWIFFLFRAIWFQIRQEIETKKKYCYIVCLFVLQPFLYGTVTGCLLLLSMFYVFIFFLINIQNLFSIHWENLSSVIFWSYF